MESTVNRHHGGLILNSRDVTERVRLQAQLQHNAEHDPLTDLPNRALFTRRVRAGPRPAAAPATAARPCSSSTSTASRRSTTPSATRPATNCSSRPPAGSRTSVRAGDTAARLGGDEFAALIVGDGTRDRSAREHQVHEIADRLRITLSQPYRIDGNEVRVAASIGVAFAEPGLGAGELMRNADLAMYRAKAAGKDRVELYAPQMQADVVRSAELATRLRAALHDGEFALLHQPVVVAWPAAGSPPSPRRRAGAPPRASSSPPPSSCAVAEDGDRTAELGRWLLEEAVEQAAERRRGRASPCPSPSG